MPHNRCYLRDASGAVVEAEGFDCGDDEEAKLLAVALSDSQGSTDLELWQSGRWVFSYTPRAVTGKAGTRAPGGSGLRTILVADDDPELRHALGHILADDDHTILTAADGYEALRTLADRHVDLLIADVRMPGIDGFELARRVKVTRPRLQVIYISGYDIDMERDAGPIFGPILHKPVRGDDLRSKIHRELSH